MSFQEGRVDGFNDKRRDSKLGRNDPPLMIDAHDDGENDVEDTPTYPEGPVP